VQVRVFPPAIRKKNTFLEKIARQGWHTGRTVCARIVRAEKVPQKVSP
jgi:hypothetical protein